MMRRALGLVTASKSDAREPNELLRSRIGMVLEVQISNLGSSKFQMTGPRGRKSTVETTMT